MSEKIALVTGASSGIGRETALQLKNNGFKVYGAARNLEKLKEIEAMGINILSLDVTNEESMLKCVKTIEEKEGRIDILVNNAGYGSYGGIEDVSIDEARRQFEVNVFGLGRMTQLVLPIMRKNSYGKIVNISSMGGKMTMPFGGWYHAAKYAVESYSDALRMETKSFGIDVIIIEPGVVESNWSHIACEQLIKSSSNGVYSKRAKEVADHLSQMYKRKGVTPPKKIADTIVKAVTVKKPKTRYLVGFMAKPTIIMKSFISDRMFDYFLQKFM